MPMLARAGVISDGVIVRVFRMEIDKYHLDNLISHNHSWLTEEMILQ